MNEPIYVPFNKDTLHIYEAVAKVRREIANEIETGKKDANKLFNLLSLKLNDKAV